MVIEKITLRTILDLVGKLDDSPGEDTPRERFRKYLKNDVISVAQLRDSIDECLREKGDQYSRALQDLINHTGHLLGFEVTFGRYQGIVGETGHDGLWLSPTGKAIIIEVKTTEVYFVKTTTLLGYIDSLVNEKKITERDIALGLYVVGKPDPEINQLESSIKAGKYTQQLRIISVDSLISLAELSNEYDVTHDDILSVIFPSGPKIDPITNLITRLVVQRQIATPETTTGGTALEPETEQVIDSSSPNYWLTPIAPDESFTAEESVQVLVGEKRIYAFGDRTPGRKVIKPGDWICFYATSNGVVAHAQVATFPERKPNKAIRHLEDYPWTFKLTASKLYLQEPIVIDAEFRTKLDAFKGRDAKTPWAWFVQFTHKLSEHDYKLLTRQ